MNKSASHCRTNCRIPALLLGGVLFLLLHGSTSAQLAFKALDGVSAARAKATETLGSNIMLVSILAPGSFDYQGLNLSFNLDDGTATTWIYIFYSPDAEQLSTILVIRPLIYFAIDAGSFNFPLPGILFSSLNTGGTYANSDKMIARLKTDTTFKNYRRDLPGASPTFVSLGQLISNDSLQLPNGFPVGQATWSLNFTGAEDSTMNCYVASETGETFCRRIYGISLGVDDHQKVTGGTLSVAPNPASDYVTISFNGVASPSVLAQSHLFLVDERGRTIRDLTPSLGSAGNSSVHINVSGLASGTYHSLLFLPDRVERVGLVIVE